MLPGIFANMAPVLFRNVEFLDYPIDFNKKWKGKPLFGSHKTYRGFFFGILLSVIVVYVQSMLFHSYVIFRELSFFSYLDINFLLLGFLIGFGALFGDLVKSFFKRRFGVKPGDSWFPWDQLDSLLGALLFISFVYVPSWQVIVFLLIAVPVLHILINHIGYYLHMRETRW